MLPLVLPLVLLIALQVLLALLVLLLVFLLYFLLFKFVLLFKFFNRKSMTPERFCSVFSILRVLLNLVRLTAHHVFLSLLLLSDNLSLASSSLQRADYCDSDSARTCPKCIANCKLAYNPDRAPAAWCYKACRYQRTDLLSNYEDPGVTQAV